MVDQQHDLGAMSVRLGNAFVAAGRPALAHSGLTMWEYVVLLALRDGPAHSQTRLAEVTGRDKTRLIPILYRLAGAGLVSRDPDPADRRNRIVALTEPGRAVVTECQRAIRRMEHDLLSPLPETDRAAFIELMQRVVKVVAPPT